MRIIDVKNVDIFQNPHNVDVDSAITSFQKGILDIELRKI